MDLTISGNPGIWGLSAKIKYDSSLELVSCSSGTLFSITPGDLGKNPYVVYGESKTLNNVTGNGKVATLVFKIADDASDGSHAVTISKTEAYSCYGDEVRIKCVNSAVVVGSGHTHSGAGPVKENVVAATCTDEGSYDEAVYCSVCGAELERRTVTVPALGHSPAGAVKKNVVNPTCTKDGRYDSVVLCSVCKETISSTAVAVPALGHDWSEWIVVSEADAVSDGMKERTCLRCGETETEVIPSTGGSTEMLYPGDRVVVTASIEASGVKSGSVNFALPFDGMTVDGGAWFVNGALLASFNDAEGFGVFAMPSPTVIKGEVFKLELTVTDAVPYDEGTLTPVMAISPDNGMKVSVDIEVIEHQHVDDGTGHCSVCGCSMRIPGDLDGNGVIDSDDAIYLLYHCFFPEYYPIDWLFPDYDHSGEVDSDDAIYLLYHCFFPENYPIY